jgi:hypothetical protein
MLAGCGRSGPTALLTVAPSAAQQLLTDTPWPSDLLLDGGHVAIGYLPTSTVDLTPFVLDDLNHTQDGFSVSAGAFFPLSDPIDPASLDGNVHLYDLASGDDLPVYVHYRQKDVPSVIYARPVIGGTLLERHTYAYVITNKVKGPSGALGPSSDLSTLLGAKSRPGDPKLGRAYDAYKPLLDFLDKGTVARGEIAGATVFTTHSITAPLVGMRAALDGAPPPAATVTMVWAKTKTAADMGSLDDLLGTPAMNLPGTDNAGGIAHDHLGYVIQGTFESPDYLNNAQAVRGEGTPTSIDVFDLDGAGVPHPKGVAVVPFTLVLPDFQTPAEYANLPVVVFQHGLGGDRSAVMGIANDNAAAGFATMGIDIPFHGGRDKTATDTMHTYGSGTGPDGWSEITDASFVPFFDATGNQSNGLPAFLPKAVRDAFMQAALDCMQEARLVRVGDLSAIAAKEPRLAMLSLRHDALAYSGESFGSMIGSITVAIEPNIGAASLDVGGGGLLFPLLLNSNTYGPKIAPFLDGALGTQTADPADPTDTDFAYNLAQYLLEQGDAGAYAPYIVLHPLGSNAPKHVIQPSAHFDETVPNQANVQLARGMGLQPVNLSSGGTIDLSLWTQPPAAQTAPVSGNLMVNGKPVTAAFIQFEEASHGMFNAQKGEHTADLTQPYPYPKIPTVDIANPIVRLHAIFVSFMRDYFDGKVPTVVSGQ